MPDDEKRPAHDAFVRWQEVTRKHLGDTVNLVLTLTTAAVGFLADLLIKKHATLTANERWVPKIFLCILGLAAIFGIAVNITRLLDFRWTTRAARLGDLKETYLSKRLLGLPQFPKWLQQLRNRRTRLRLWWIRRGSLNPLPATDTSVGQLLDGKTEMAMGDFRAVRRACHDIADWFGEWTWCLLKLQLATFGAGIIFLAAALFPTKTSTPDARREVGRFVETEAGSFILIDTSTGQWCLAVNKKPPNSDLELCRDLH